MREETIPPPPKHLPSEVIKGYDVEGYWKLIGSLTPLERKEVLKELELPEVIRRAISLEKQFAKNSLIISKPAEARETFLAALLCLQQNRITIHQLATLHLLDSAVRTLYTHSVAFVPVKDKTIGTSTDKISTFVIPQSNRSQSFVYQLSYSEPYLSDILGKTIPKTMKKSLLARYFNFTEREWEFFKKELKKAPESERHFYVLTAPQSGCWSQVVFAIQKILECMRDVDLYQKNCGRDRVQKIVVVPSFSMYQAAIKAKAETLGRQPIRLIPAYDYIKPGFFSRYKCMNDSPFVLYLPEKDISLQYKHSAGRFRQTIDGYPYETAFAGAIHDVYHAFREMMMNEGTALARMRLVAVAKNHRWNRSLSHTDKFISRILIDGELIFNYSQDEETIFDHNIRPMQKESFADLFYTSVLVKHLHQELKNDFILDMKIHSDEWQHSFGIGKKDLHQHDQRLYDVIEEVCLRSAINNNDAQKIKYITTFFKPKPVTAPERPVSLQPDRFESGVDEITQLRGKDTI